MTNMLKLWTDARFLEAIGDGAPPNVGALNGYHLDESALDGGGAEGRAASPFTQAGTVSAGPAPHGGHFAGPAPKGGPPADDPSDKITKLLQELERLEKLLEATPYTETVKRKKIQKDIDAVQAKIEEEGGVAVSSRTLEPPPSLPADADGQIVYTGVPMDRIKDPREREIARRRAEYVRHGVTSLSSETADLKEKSSIPAEKKDKLDKVKAHSQEMDAAFANDMKRGAFKALANKEPEFDNVLGQYQSKSTEVKTALNTVKEQAYHVAAAMAFVEQTKALLDAYDTEKKKDADGKKLEGLKQQLDTLKGGVNFVFDAIKDPQGTAKDVAKKFGLKMKDALVDKIVDGLLGGDVLKKQMADLQTEIAALDKRLDELHLTALTAGVNQATNNLQAELTATENAQENVKKAKQEQSDAVFRLANMEKRHPETTTVFRSLQQYYEEVQNAGHDAMEASKQYSGKLDADSDIATRTDNLKKNLAQDRVALNRLYGLAEADPDELQALEKNRAMEGYADATEAWYEKQMQEQKAFQDDLRANKQFEYIGTLVKKVKQDGLEDVHRDEKATN